MKQTLAIRRRKLLRLRGKGYSLEDSVNELSIEYGVTRECIWKDWRNRRKWMPQVLEISDREAFFYDVISDHKEIARLVIHEFLTADNSNARIAALKLRRTINRDLLWMLHINQLTERMACIEDAAKEHGLRLED